MLYKVVIEGNDDKLDYEKDHRNINEALEYAEKHWALFNYNCITILSANENKNDESNGQLS